MVAKLFARYPSLLEWWVHKSEFIFSGFPLGHPFGFPGQSFHQLQIIRLLLKSLQQIRVLGTIAELNLGHIGKQSDACAVCVAG